MSELLTVDELAGKLKVARQTIYRWRKIGMPTIKKKKLVRFDFEDVIKWMKEG